MTCSSGMDKEESTLYRENSNGMALCFPEAQGQGCHVSLDKA